MPTTKTPELLAAWQRFARAMPKTTPPELLELLRHAYYSGATVAAKLLTEAALDDNDASGDMRFENIMAEVAVFYQQVDGGRG